MNHAFLRQRGFTLIELIMVMVITGILAGVVVVFFRPAIDAYTDSRRRADLSDEADTALRRITLDVRRAVPNSLRVLSSSCLQLVPTSSGGRYRIADDPTLGGRSLDTTTTTTSFDVLSPLSTAPAAGDWVVVNNQNGNDVYNGSNRGQIANYTSSGVATGSARITLQNAVQFPLGYDGGRFLIVDNSEQSIFYTCQNGGLFRNVRSFADNTGCSGSDTLVSLDVAQCRFAYSAGITQQSGLLWAQLTLTRSGESVNLAHAAHIDNVP